MNPQTDNVTENHSTNIKIYYLTNSGRRTQINATTGSYQFDAFYSRHSQQTQQYPKTVVEDGVNKLPEAAKEERKR